MARVSLTRLELKRQRDRLARFERFLPSLRLRQQQLQLALLLNDQELQAARAHLQAARADLERYATVLQDLAGLNLPEATQPVAVVTAAMNVAGVSLPVFQGVEFRAVQYSLFATPPWVDRALHDLRAINERAAAVTVLERAHALLRRELLRVLQRVNLFEKVKIPEAQRIIDRIRVQLGDEMAAGVGRAKIAKGRIAGRAEAGSVT